MADVKTKQRVQKVLMYVGFVFIVGAMAFLIITGGTTGMIGGVGVFVGAAMIFIGNRPPKRDAGVPARKRDSLIIPRRWIYGYFIGIGITALGIGLTAISALGIGSSSSSFWRTAPELVVLIAIPLTITGLVILIGALLQRGYVRLGVTELAYVKVAGRTKRFAWTDLNSKPTHDRHGITVVGGGRRFVIPSAAQTWTVHRVVNAIERFRAASVDGRRRMIETTEIARPLV